jgi:hypothetical protein
MPSTTINASQVIGKTLTALQNVDFFYPIGTKLGTIKKGDTIGVVYSYAYGGTPDLYWMIDKGNNQYIFVKHDINKLNLIGGSQILQDIKNQQIKQEIEEKGLLRYYLDKYLPYIVGGVVIYFALPTIKKTFTNEK